MGIVCWFVDLLQFQDISEKEKPQICQFLLFLNFVSFSGDSITDGKLVQYKF